MVIHRYMTEDKHNRIVAHIFAPELAPGETLNDDTRGTARVATREQPSDMWGFPRGLAPTGVPYRVWKTRVEMDGFTFGDDCESK